MRLLQLHSDYFSYTAISKEIRLAEDNVKQEKMEFNDIVVNFVAIEKNDNDTTINRALDEIRKYTDTIKSFRIVLYPYAHLSTDLADADKAFNLLKLVEEKAIQIFGKNSVFRAPFGWTKSFEIKVKGHPLAESYRVIGDNSASESIDISKDTSDINSSENVSQALKNEEKIKSKFYIFDDDYLNAVSQYNFKENKNLEILVDYEISKKRTVDVQPPHVQIMKKLAIADYEPASDNGNLRFYPKGRLIKSLIEQFVTRKVIEYGGIEVETPIMYDSHHHSMQSYFNRFPARQYTIQSDNKHLFLRFAACFGQFLMAKDFQISYKHLPLKLYELTRYSFRREKSGELVGLRRLRAFSMPDCHALCRNLDQAKDEILKRFDLSYSVIQEIGLDKKDVEMVVRCTQDFFDEHKQLIMELSKKFGRPIFLEIWQEKFFYFILKWEFNFIDTSGKASALSTDQIDVENGERYDITFTDENGLKQNPIILHNSPSGAVERVIYALLERASRISKKGGISSLPLWLNNTQVRLIPVSNDYISFCNAVLERFCDSNIRVDIDDREESVAKKIRDAEKEWIRYSIVIGANEVQSNGNVFVIRDRENKNQRQISLEQLIKEIKEIIKGKPFLPINLPIYLSKRPQIMV